VLYKTPGGDTEVFCEFMNEHYYAIDYAQIPLHLSCSKPA